MNLPYKEKNIEKKYFTIGEVSKIIGISPPLIRFWEKQLDLPVPKSKTPKSTKKYILKQIATLKKVKKLLRDDKYTLKGVKEKLKNKKQQKNPKELIKSLTEAKKFLNEIKNLIT